MLHMCWKGKSTVDLCARLGTLVNTFGLVKNNVMCCNCTSPDMQQPWRNTENNAYSDNCTNGKRKAYSHSKSNAGRKNYQLVMGLLLHHNVERHLCIYHKKKVRLYTHHYSANAWITLHNVSDSQGACHLPAFAWRWQQFYEITSWAEKHKLSTLSLPFHRRKFRWCSADNFAH